jgi:modification methylase
MDRDETYVRVAKARVESVVPGLFADAGYSLDAPKPRVPFMSLVEQGILPVGTQLWLMKTDVTATVNADGTITAKGLSGSIHKVGKMCLDLPACNGWTTWYFRDAHTDEMRLIDSLRPDR